MCNLWVRPSVARWGLSLCTEQTWLSPFLQTDQPERKSHSLMWWETYNHTHNTHTQSISESTQQMTHWTFIHLHAFDIKKYTHLLILLPSLSLSPAAPVLDTRSLPARSTRLILLTFSPEFCLPPQHEPKVKKKQKTNEVSVNSRSNSLWKRLKSKTRLTPDWRS